MQETYVTHRPIRLALVLVIATISVAGCNRGGAAKPTQKRMMSRALNHGHFGVTRQAKIKIVPGPLTCKVKLDDKAESVTSDCATKTPDGKSVTVHVVSTYNQLRKNRVALPGDATITVEGGKPFKATCLGSSC